VIEVRALSRTFRVHKKAPGFWGSLRSLVRREWVEKHAVREVSFRVAEGEIVGLLGPNGAGKTTLVKMLAGIVHPSGGSASVLGFDPWQRATEFRRQIALVMGQKAQLWWDLPAADGFLLLKEIYRVPDDRYRKNLDYLASVLAVEKELGIPVRRLSLGERMKMELIAALLHSPRVVFLDEPTIGLDLSAQRAIREFVLRYREERRPAMIVTSHYMEDIERLCPRVLILSEGRLVYDGRLDRIAARYADHRVVTVHLQPPTDPAPAPPDLSDLGEVLERTDLVVKVRVPAARVATAAAAILQRLPVADLSIEEPEVGAIVERIYRDRGTTPP
jgi:ABC-2 type transport system ATP-binding protein